MPASNDSSIDRRSQNTTTAAIPPSPNATRQPQSADLSRASSHCSISSNVACASTWPPTRVT
jgi:hypothetical protein